MRVVFATSCALNVPASASARPSTSRITPAPGSRPIVAYAHSVFATSCALNVPATASARPSSPLITPAPGSRPIVAYARSVFANLHADFNKRRTLPVPIQRRAHIARLDYHVLSNGDCFARMTFVALVDSPNLLVIYQPRSHDTAVSHGFHFKDAVVLFTQS